MPYWLMPFALIGVYGEWPVISKPCPSNWIGPHSLSLRRTISALNQPLGDLADDDPDFAQKRIRGTRQRPLARVNHGSRDLAGRLEGTDREIIAAAEQRRERID